MSQKMILGSIVKDLIALDEYSKEHPELNLVDHYFISDWLTAREGPILFSEVVRIWIFGENQKFWQLNQMKNLVLVVKTICIMISRISLEDPGAKLSWATGLA